jgi:hypothetical protein
MIHCHVVRSDSDTLVAAYDSAVDWLFLRSVEDVASTHGFTADATLTFDLAADSSIVFAELMFPSRLWSMSSNIVAPNCGADRFLLVIDENDEEVEVQVRTNNDRSVALIGFGQPYPSEAQWFRLSQSVCACTHSGMLLALYVDVPR